MTDINKTSDTLTGSESLQTRNKERFCKLYVASPFGMGAIYREAGYNPKDDDGASHGASRLLKDVQVQQRIAFLRAERDERIGRNADSVVEGLFESRDRCAEGKILRDRQGKPITVEINVEGVNMKHAVVWKYDTVGFHKASELLARYFGILTDKVVVDDVRKLADKYDNEAEDIIETMLNSEKMVYKPAKKDSVNQDNIVIPIDESGKVHDTVRRSHVVVDKRGTEHSSKQNYPDRKAEA